MNPDQTAHVRAHVAAVSKLVLGNKIMNPGLMILAGDPLGHFQQIAFGRTAVEAQVDLVYLEFAIGEDDVPVMTGITVTLPRDTVCYVSTGCRLSLVPGKARAVIVPQDGAQSHFKVLPGEILQLRGRPASLVAGCDRADAKLAVLVREGAEVGSQVTLQTWCRYFKAAAAQSAAALSFLSNWRAFLGLNHYLFLMIRVHCPFQRRLHAGMPRLLNKGIMWDFAAIPGNQHE